MSSPLSDKQRNELRQLQNKLLFHMQAIPAYRTRWGDPLVLNGPTPKQMETILYPDFAMYFEEFLQDLLAKRGGIDGDEDGGGN